MVEARIAAVFDAWHPTQVVSSAACGADLLVLEAARRRHVPYEVVLPFPRPFFRSRSVEDCPGSWERRFDVLLDDPPPGSAVTVLGPAPVTAEAEQAGYAATTRALMTHAARHANLLSAGGTAAIVTALATWDGLRKPAPAHDETHAFRELAAARGWRIQDVGTL